jgi:hypothetical protein
MGLALLHIDKSVDIEGIDAQLSILYEKKKEIEEEIRELHYAREKAFLSSLKATHNLVPMAKEAGLYNFLWHPEEIGISLASQLIDPLEEGIIRLKATPEKFKKLNPPNGWGSYEGFVKFCESVLRVCRNYPDSTIEADT